MGRKPSQSLMCTRCGEDFLGIIPGLCPACTSMKYVVDAGEACPNCWQPFEGEKPKECRHCGRLIGDRIFCSGCHKEIMYMTDFGSSNVEVEVNNFRDVFSKTSSTKHEEVLCLACFKKANKPPDPETTDQKLDRLIECFQGIAEILRIIAGNQ